MEVALKSLCQKLAVSKRFILKKLNNALNKEKEINAQSYRNFNLRLENVKTIINHFFDICKNKKIIGYGASTKGNIILNHSKITNKKLKMICDGNKQKWGRYTPGSKLKSFLKKMRRLKPDFFICF